MQVVNCYVACEPVIWVIIEDHWALEGRINQTGNSDVADLVSNFVQKKRVDARKKDLMQNLSECWNTVRDKVEFAEHGRSEGDFRRFPKT